MIGESAPVARNWGHPASSLVFIDGGHSLDSCRADVAGFSPHSSPVRWAARSSTTSSPRGWAAARLPGAATARRWRAASTAPRRRPPLARCGCAAARWHSKSDAGHPARNGVARQQHSGARAARDLTGREARALRVDEARQIAAGGRALVLEGAHKSAPAKRGRASGDEGEGELGALGARHPAAESAQAAHPGARHDEIAPAQGEAVTRLGRRKRPRERGVVPVHRKLVLVEEAPARGGAPPARGALGRRPRPGRRAPSRDGDGERARRGCARSRRQAAASSEPGAAAPASPTLQGTRLSCETR